MIHASRAGSSPSAKTRAAASPLSLSGSHPVDEEASFVLSFSPMSLRAVRWSPALGSESRAITFELPLLNLRLRPLSKEKADAAPAPEELSPLGLFKMFLGSMNWMILLAAVLLTVERRALLFMSLNIFSRLWFSTEISFGKRNSFSSWDEGRDRERSGMRRGGRGVPQFLFRFHH
jgi:hypothetical protein